ncbi:hypothetical protein [Streptomyces camelliae]|uniref:Uncharacterized protein n=1 Tax=Streptomyces camelliae TaxID=3004093 RepID=A0ABY7PB52_9ACTN|nr:hypothetical protein [Streptomyces sp. HUAS 2-6]WBO67816.1 hypothetical protein O1G22_35840 [Streptomyces sp. HUAS 2-6]
MRASSGRPEPRLVLAGGHPLRDEALAAVNRDLAVTVPGLPALRLIVCPDADDLDEQVYVALSDGEAHGTCLIPAEWAGEAMTAVADAAQETVTERLWRAWPVCTVHDLGMHARDVDGTPSWWCAGGSRKGDPAHIRAAIGDLDTLHPPRRPNRRRRKTRRPR